MKKVAILGIDLQNDFTTPSGSLFVSNADKDVDRVVDFIKRNQKKIDYIAFTLDSHQPIHVAHQCYWKNKDGQFPDLFTTITLDDVLAGVWEAQYNKEKAELYLNELTKKGDVCTIWPMHCINGSAGWAIDSKLMSIISKWSIDNDRMYELFFKGYNQFTEHYSIFRAAVEWEGYIETQLNLVLLQKLNEYDEVILVGEAADFCVASSLNDILDENETLARKIVVLTDCTSWIIKDNARAQAIFEKAKQMSVRFELSTDYSIE